MANVEELERALEFPWDKWTIFLHPEQREWVERDYNGPARVSGSAGTGKTIVALHRAVHLAREQSRRPRPAHHLLRAAGERPAHEAEAACSATSRASPSGSTSTPSTPSASGCTRRTSARPSSPTARHVANCCERHRSCRGRTQVQPPLPADRVGAGRRCLAAARPGRSTATSPGSAGRPGCPKRSGRSSGRSSSACAQDLKARGAHHASQLCSPRWPRRSRQSNEPAVRFRRGGRGAGHQRGAAAFLRRARGRSARTACSSPATWASGSSSSRSRGSRSAWTFAAARARCASTTAPPTRSARRPTACSAPR